MATFNDFNQFNENKRDMYVLKLINKIITYLLTTHFFIACIAVALALETSIVLNQPFQPLPLYFLLFSSTHFAYNIYYIKTAQAKRFGLHAFISIIASGVLLFFIPTYTYPTLLLIGFTSTIYILPIFIRVNQNNRFTIIKLVLLIVTWVLTTWVLAASPIQFQFKDLVYLCYRIVFISISCLLFFIRDEKVESLKRKATQFNKFLIGFQLILSIIILFKVSLPIGIVYFITSIGCYYLACIWTKQARTHLQYLAYVDGILFIQASILIILFYFNTL